MHTGRMKDSERDRAGRGAEGERKNSQAKGSDLDDASESAGFPHTKGATAGRWPRGNLSGEDGGRMTEGFFCLFFMCFHLSGRRGWRPLQRGTRVGRDALIPPPIVGS